MNEEYITLETAKLSKEKGFNFELDLGSNCTCYDEHGELVSYHVHFQYPDKSRYIFAPPQTVLQKWLREKHNIQVYALSGTISKKRGRKPIYKNYVVHVNEKEINDARDEEFQTYEEAMEVGLQVALEMI